MQTGDEPEEQAGERPIQMGEDVYKRQAPRKAQHVTKMRSDSRVSIHAYERTFGPLFTRKGHVMKIPSRQVRDDKNSSKCY